MRSRCAAAKLIARSGLDAIALKGTFGIQNPRKQLLNSENQELEASAGASFSRVVKQLDHSY